VDRGGRSDQAGDAHRFLPPSADHLFGTDNFGRSLWSRVIWGARLSMIIGVSVVAINAVFGTLIGARRAISAASTTC
jgi:ABC-type dipeptide/oligopeptide/nickel transport system permease subunit